MLVFLSVLVAYWPALNGKFIWDDVAHVTRPDLRTWDGLGRIWFEVGATQQYYPLLHSAFWLEHRLWGDAPLGYHLVNLLLHGAAACLLAALLRRLAVPGAWLAAFLFALHPVSVESVAWISEQKNTLSTVFYLASALAYVRFDETRRRRSYAWATVCFVLALLTKTVTATLPAALLVMLWWRRRKAATARMNEVLGVPAERSPTGTSGPVGGGPSRLEFKHDVVPLLPWFVLGVVAGLTTAWVESTLIGAQAAAYASSPIERMLIAGRVVWFYVGKLLWPANLTFIYPRWTVDATSPWQYAFPLAVLAAFVVLWRWRRRFPGTFAAALIFGGTLFPVLGFLNVFPFIYSFVADHFQYLASIGVFTAVAAGVAVVTGGIDDGRRAGDGSETLAGETSRAGTPRPRKNRVSHVGGAPSPCLPAIRVSRRFQAMTIPLLVVIGLLTVRQSATYRDPFLLYETTMARNPACWMAYNNLGVALSAAGRPEQAVVHFRRSIALRPENAEAQMNLGAELSKLGRHEEALPYLRRALELRPDLADAHHNLGLALMGLDRQAEARAAFEAGVRLHPRDALAHYDLGLALSMAGRPAEAVLPYQRAIALRPRYAEAELNLAVVLATLGRFAEAVPHFERSIELRSDSPAPYYAYGRVLAANGRYDEAIARLRAALKIDPNFAPARRDLAVLLRQLGRSDEARAHLLKTQRLGQ